MFEVVCRICSESRKENLKRFLNHIKINKEKVFYVRLLQEKIITWDITYKSTFSFFSEISHFINRFPRLLNSMFRLQKCHLQRVLQLQQLQHQTKTRNHSKLQTSNWKTTKWFLVSARENEPAMQTLQNLVKKVQ